jgi:cytochrome c oxidase assembly protein subunit 15
VSEGRPLPHADRQIAIWLLICALAVFALVVLGGVTRLTHSGLSMVDWQPILGVIPPLTQEAWQAAFDAYKQYPEYQKVNAGMSLDGFKSIFWFEYAHRLVGRGIGFLFAVPLLYFLLRGYVRRPFIPKLVGLFLLGGLQGLMGWYMVQSGLVDDPKVSQYRLTAHLALAVVIYGYMLWLALDLLAPRTPERSRGNRFAYAVSITLFVMILSGGFVAGTRAGLLYGTWPLMGESFFPAGLYATDPFWLAALEDVVTIQFNHRLLAYLSVGVVGCFAWLTLREGATGKVRVGIFALVLTLLAQLGLGIATLLYRVPIDLAAMHQGMALVLFASSLYLSHTLRLPGSNPG